MQRKKKRGPTTIEEAFAEAIDAFIEAYLEKRKQDFHSHLESFDQYATRTSKTLREAIVEFKERFLRGYSVLVNDVDT